MITFPPTKAEVEDYVSTLDPCLQSIYRSNSNFLICAADTLEDDFQISAEIENVFRTYTRLKGQPLKR